MSDFGKRLEQLRTERGLTHQQMADMLGITRQGYGNYESGKREPDIETVRKLASFFDVTVDYLLTGRTDSDFGQANELSPEVKIFLDDFLSAPEEKKAEVMKYWHRIVKDSEDNKGEPKESAWDRARRNKRK